MSAGAFTAARGAAWLEDLDPRMKLCWLACVSLLSVVLDSVVGLGVLCALSSVVITGLRMPARAWGLLGFVLAAIVWGTILSQGLFYAAEPRTTLVTLLPPWNLGGWQLGGLRLYREGLTYGLAQSLRMIAVTLAGLAVCLSTTPPRLLAALTWLRVPSAIGFMTVASLRFVPLVLGEYQTVRQARWLRSGARQGINTRPWQPFAQMRVGIALLVPVIAAALRRATALATSVAARGFDPAARHAPYPPLRMRLAEGLALAALLATTGAIVAAKVLYWLYVGEMYYRPTLRPLYELARSWM
ncbi:MAG: energy-coupling factor transporter transmembrane protein EcfT [Pirellulales bacterium]|nr:energy-coupling factor transporter transmembrane protein EcfT [Pirellulales bacterium]